VSKVKLSKLSAVAILLVVFSSPWITDFILACNFNSCEVAFSTQNHHDKNSKSDGCCSDDNNCCCDKISLSLLSDLPVIITPSFQHQVKTHNSSIFIDNNDSIKDDYLSQKRTPYQLKLPPKIPDIRVFIQSFII
jgi:hypothetical protein